MALSFDPMTANAVATTGPRRLRVDRSDSRPYRIEYLQRLERLMEAAFLLALAASENGGRA